jgi:hypothetical protein
MKAFPNDINGQNFEKTLEYNLQERIMPLMEDTGFDDHREDLLRGALKMLFTTRKVRVHQKCNQ